jgi:predicted TIM-barrel fold metal-dependent hydrolase
LKELEGFNRKYSHIQWILAHCATSFHPKQLETAILRLRDLPNLWYDTSAVCETYPQALLLKYESRKRILFGTDSAIGIGGCRRGRVVSLADRVEYLKIAAHATFWCYEQLRAQRQACELLDLGRGEVEDIFRGNAERLTRLCRR